MLRRAVFLIGMAMFAIHATTVLAGVGGDTTPPEVISITTELPSPTSETNLAFQITFSEEVNDVGLDDLGLTNTGAIVASFVESTSAPDPANTSVWNVSVNSGICSGSIRLNVVDNDTITDGAGNPLGGPGANNGSFFSGQTFVVARASANRACNTAVPTLSKWGVPIMAILLGAIGLIVLRRMN